MANIAQPIASLAIPIAGLNYDPANARRHNAKNLDAIKASLAKFGQRKPIVVQREGMIVRAGNGTLAAAKALGWDKVAAVVLDDDNATASQFAIADNRTAELAEWDNETLASLLDGWDADTRNALGFEQNDIDQLMKELTPDEVVEDEVPEVPVEAVTKPGDLWILGEHRVLCGDSTKEQDVKLLMNQSKADLCFTSPPYASQRDYDESSGFRPIRPDDYMQWWFPIQQNIAKHLTASASFFLNIKEHCEDGQRHLYVKDLVTAHVRQWQWRFIDEFCWKRLGPPGKWPNRFKSGWEPVFHFSRSLQIKFRPEAVAHESSDVFTYNAGNQRKRKTGSGFSTSDAGRRQTGMALPSNVIESSTREVPNGIAHSAAFPLSLPSFFIMAFTDASDSIYEPFCGSGTTLIAAEQLGRKCYGMEISPQYCDVIVKRWESLTGKKAVLEHG
jgi:hypothetical protein